MAGLIAMAMIMFQGDDAEAFNTCNEACAVIGYAIITGGGVTTAAASQITLLQGEPSSEWGTASLAFAGANAGVGGVILIVAAVMAATDDDDAKAIAVWGGIQMGIALVGLVSAAHIIANDEQPPGANPAIRPAGATLSIDF